MTTVSITLATYNGSRFLGQQLQTLASQEWLPDELVVSDDASIGGTVAKIEAFAATEPFPVRRQRNAKRLGYRANLMRAAGLCRSAVIAFCDDLWEPRKLHACLAPFEDREALKVYHAALAIARDGTSLAPVEHPTALALANYLQSIPMVFVIVFTQLFRSLLRSRSQLRRRSIDHKEVRRRNPMAHHQWFCLLGSVLGSIPHIDEAQVRERQHGSDTFGWNAPSPLAKIAQCQLHGRAELYAALEMGVERRTDVLDQLALTLAGGWQVRANAGAEQYCAMAQLYGERQRSYGSAPFRDGSARFCRLLMSDGYRSKRHWRLGARALLTDLCFGLPAGYRLSARRARLIPRRSGD